MKLSVYKSSVNFFYYSDSGAPKGRGPLRSDHPDTGLKCILNIISGNI